MDLDEYSYDLSYPSKRAREHFILKKFLLVTKQFQYSLTFRLIELGQKSGYFCSDFFILKFEP